MSTDNPIALWWRLPLRDRLILLLGALAAVAIGYLFLVLTLS